MERSTFKAMLEAASGVEREANQYSVAEGYNLTLYIGEPGQAMEIAEVGALSLDPGFCKAESSEHHSVYFIEYSSLHGLSIRPPSGSGGRRAGFS